MADINDYVDNLNYQFNEREKSLMDIFAECWEYCRGHECKDCKYSNGNKHIKMMICMSYQYAQKLIAADVQEVRHGEWKQCFEDWRQQIEGDKCSVCGFEYYGTSIRHYHYCPECGAKMDKEREKYD